MSKESPIIHNESNSLSLDSIQENVALIRQKRDKKDYTLLKKSTVPNIEDLSKTTNGCHYSITDGIRIDYFFYKKTDNAPLYIFFNGSLSGDIPEFKRWSYYNYLDGYILNIADPMYYANPGLGLGWYWGDENTNYREIISKFIKKIICNINYSEIIFFASSAGGACAIDVADSFKPCKVILINPQLKLGLYRFRKAFETKTNINLSLEDKYSREDVTEKLFNGNKIILMSNISSEDERIQLKYVASKYNLDIKYGVNKYRNLIIWTYDAPGEHPHNNQEFIPMTDVIIQLIKDFDKIGQLEKYIDLFGEFWYDHYALRQYYLKKDHMLSEYRIKSKNKYSISFVDKDIKWLHEKICLLDTNATYTFVLKNISPSKRCSIIIKNKSTNQTIHKLILDETNINEPIQMHIGLSKAPLELRIYPGLAEEYLDSDMFLELEITSHLLKQKYET
ncbi:hypothetical protein [Methanomethylophilus alvi]|uniref:hypothetical protein n=1 Tax=Methanomethylophilus alvi TaxID=1291540 RepID=UPI0037DCCA18